MEIRTQNLWFRTVVIKLLLFLWIRANSSFQLDARGQANTLHTVADQATVDTSMKWFWVSAVRGDSGVGCCVGVWKETTVEWRVQQRGAAPHPAKRVCATSTFALCSLLMYFFYFFFFNSASLDFSFSQRTVHIFCLAKTEACKRCGRVVQFSSYTLKICRNALFKIHFFFFLKLSKLIIPNSVLFGRTEMIFIASALSASVEVRFR